MLGTSGSSWLLVSCTAPASERRPGGHLTRPADIVLLSSILVTLLAPLIWRVARRRFDPFEPIVVFALAYGVMFVIRPGAMLLEDSLVYEGPRASLDVSETFTEMLALALLGAIGFVVAYSTPIGARLARSRRGPARDLNERRLVVASLVTGFLGSAVYVLGLASSGLTSTIDAILRAGNADLPEASSASIYATFLFLMVVPATLVVLGLGLERRRASLFVASAGLAALVLVRALPLGSRITLLPLVGGAFVLYFLRRSARPSVPAIALVAVVALLGSAFLSDLRGRAARDESVTETLGRATSPSRLTHPFTRGPDTEMAPVLAAALTVLPERFPHSRGTTLAGDLLSRPIPRSLWEDKPLTPRQRLVAEIWPIEYARGSINPEFSALLYFYWDFGVIGVLLGLALYGTVARYFFEYFRLHDEHLYTQVFYALALTFVVIGVRDNPVDTFVRASFVFLPLWLIFAVSKKSADERARGTRLVANERARS